MHEPSNVTAMHMLHYMQITSCGKCQWNNPKVRKGEQPLHPIPVKPREWYQVGIDLIGPLQQSKKGNKYIAVMVDYFTKWVEASPIPDKTAKTVAHYIYSVSIYFDKIYSY